LARASVAARFGCTLTIRRARGNPRAVAVWGETPLGRAHRTEG